MRNIGLAVWLAALQKRWNSGMSGQIGGYYDRGFVAASPLAHILWRDALLEVLK